MNRLLLCGKLYAKVSQPYCKFNSNKIQNSIRYHFDSMSRPEMDWFVLCTAVKWPQVRHSRRKFLPCYGLRSRRRHKQGQRHSSPSGDEGFRRPKDCRKTIVFDKAEIPSVGVLLPKNPSLTLIEDSVSDDPHVNFIMGFMSFAWIRRRNFVS